MGTKMGRGKGGRTRKYTGKVKVSLYWEDGRRNYQDEERGKGMCGDTKSMEWVGVETHMGGVMFVAA